MFWKGKPVTTKFDPRTLKPGQFPLVLLLAPVPAAVEIGINVAEMIRKILHFGADLTVEISETAYWGITMKVLLTINQNDYI